MKKTILSLLVALMATTGATAQSPATSGITWNIGTNSGTFAMPAYDVEVSTELWYRLSETASDNETKYGTKTNVFLERTLQAGGWNTFCAPFAISNPASVFGTGVQVKAFNGSSLSDGTLTLNFTDAAAIAAATPYLIKLGGESNVDLTAVQQGRWQPKRRLEPRPPQRLGRGRRRVNTLRGISAETSAQDASAVPFGSTVFLSAVVLARNGCG